MEWKKYAKALVAILGAVIAAVVASVNGVDLDGHGWTNVGLLLTTAAAVYVAPNVPGAKYTKVILAALGALVTGFVSSHTGGFTQTEVIQLAVAVLTAVGVYGAKNVNAAGTNISETGNVGTV